MEGWGEPAVVDRSLDLDDFWTRLVECHNDVPALLRVIAGRVVDLFGDGCVLTILSPDGQTLRPEVVVHSDPQVEAAMATLLAANASRVGEGLAGTVAADRRPLLLNEVEPQTVVETTPSQYRAFVRDHPIHAMMFAPLLAAGELVGTIGSLRTTTTEPYTPNDLRVLEALAERAALAYADARVGPRSIGAADFEALYRYNLDGVLFTTPDGHVLAANPAACSILGLTERQIIDGGRDAILAIDDPGLAAALVERAASGHARAELQFRRGDGSTFVADVSSAVFSTPDRRARTIVIFRDIDDQVRARENAMTRVAELERAADRDPLTGLWNRRGFAIAAGQALASADREGAVAQVVFLDMDGLKAINDRSGHAAGDEAILAVATAVGRSIRHPDVACRFGGDEFVILLVGTASHEIEAIIGRIERALSSDDGGRALTFSVGAVQRLPGSAIDLDALIDAADRDMYQRRMIERLRRPM